MDNQIKLFKHKPLFLAIFVWFLVPNLIIAQQHSYDYIVNRIDQIDNELTRLTYLKKGISSDFKVISNFSIEARPILAMHNKYEKAISLKKKELRTIFMDRNTEEEKEAELQFLEAHRDDHYTKYKESGGIFSNIGKVKVQSKTIEELQREYNRVTNHYLKKKTEYDNIALELGKLNREKLNLETELKYIGNESDEYFDLDLQGCWVLQFGNYVSNITVQKRPSGKFEGILAVNNLNDYVDGQVMFIVDRISNNTFRGTEYTWKDRDGLAYKVKIPVVITINKDGNFLTWTSDQTVTMQRCAAIRGLN